MFYGFDLFFQVSGNGLDLENFLFFCLNNNYGIDWYNFQRTSISQGWTFDVLVRKLSFPIVEVYGKDYWEQLLKRFKMYEMSLIK